MNAVKMKATTRDANKLLLEGSLALSEIESNGVRVDMSYLEAQIQSAEFKIKEMQAELRRDRIYREWKKLYGDKTKLGSKEQLAKVIFDVMGHERPKGTSKKHRNEDGSAIKRESKYNAEVFQDVDEPFVKTYFRCEKWKKLKGTYLEGIRREAVLGDNDCWFVHPFYHLHKVISYRSSCSQPNFQNVIARNAELSKIIRSCYIPRKGNHLGENDYGTQEVRISACYNGDPVLISYIKDKSKDMHRDMAAKLFGFKTKWMIENADWAKKRVRDWAKNRFVFPQFYGQVHFECAKALWRGVMGGDTLPDGTNILDHLKKQGIKELGDCEPGAELRSGTFVKRVKEVEDFLWNETFTAYTAWKNRWYAEYLRKGYFNLFTGFRISGLFKRNDVLNYSIQGDAFLCLLQALVWILKATHKYKMKTLIVGEIHDSFQFDGPGSEFQDFLDLSYEIMVSKMMKSRPWITVPLEVEMEVCPQDKPWVDKKV